MGIYTDHKGIEKDTASMPIEYILRALAKATSPENIKALQDEIDLRNGTN